MKKYLKTWLANGRSGSLVQSVMPAVLSVFMASGNQGFNLWLALLAIVGVECAHLAVNLLDDYFDYKVDMKGDRDAVIRQGMRAMTAKYPYLTDGSSTTRDLLKAISIFGTVAIACGFVIFIFRSWNVVWIAAAAAFLGYFYSAPPFKFAYYGLGELVTGIIFGPLLVLGVSYAACGEFVDGIYSVAIPVGLLVINILFTHSFIDAKADEVSNKMTFARVLKTQGACLTMSYLINVLPFVMVVVAVIAGKLNPLFLLSLLALPRALWLCISLTKFVKGDVDIQSVPKFMGDMSDWQAISKAGLGWFMGRWLAARNTLSLFCLMIIVSRILILIFF